MHIIIKSFNRPYYLDRCLQSIYQYVTGDFTLRVLDDGTPPEYLKRIQEKFPAVQIALSPLYHDKVAAIERHVAGGKPFDQKIIPFDFWVKEVRNCSDVFLLLEDDIWLTGLVSLTAFAAQMRANHFAMVKLSWLGNERLNQGKRAEVAPIAGAEVEEMVPKLPWGTQAVFLNRFRVRSVLYRTGLLKRFFKSDFERQLPLYTLYAVASAFFDKAYWLYLWPAGQTEAKEYEQLHKAAAWWRRTGSRFAKSKQELTRTSFITSATNTFEGVNLDPYVLNHVLNQAWLRGDLDPMQSFPKDFGYDYLQPIIEAAGDDRASYPGWVEWAKRFKAQYRSFGCILD